MAEERDRVEPLDDAESGTDEDEASRQGGRS